MQRRKTRTVSVRNVKIGFGHPISVQSMCDIPTSDHDGCLRQISRLKECGCDIVRLTVNTAEAAKGFAKIRENTDMPLVADIHFDYKMALAAIDAGADKIRINPGNIGDADKVKQVADACRVKGLPIRIGVNGGSLEKDILAKYGRVCPEALCESALYHASLLERFDFTDIVLSVKSSDVFTNVEATALLAEKCDFPIHIGVTEAGALPEGLIKNSAGIGALLSRGIGDTLRISLTDPPEEEVKAGIKLLKALKLRKGIDLVACPTCGRTQIDLKRLYAELRPRLDELECGKELTVALMGCVVNGPGEAKEADIGVAGGKNEAVLIRKGQIVGKINEEDIVDTLISEVKDLLN